ncbi:MAG: hypothetical protein ACJ754_12395 [Pyrinomonadaceae bacterium]
MSARNLVPGVPWSGRVFDKRVAEAVAREVEEAAYRTGVARRERSRADVLM